jgi:hypothetical protein
MIMAKLYYGVDAQPIGNMNWALSLGANALHRYDSNGGKDTMAFWISEARKRNLSYILQGTQADSQKWDYTLPDPNLIALQQDDEPDLNRYKADDQGNWANIFTPTNPPPHPSMMGWTRPKILKDRYQAWRSKLPIFVPVTINFAGPNLTNPYTQPTTSLHKLYYQPCSDQGGMDLYSENNDADRWNNYGPVHAIRRLSAWGFNPVDAYFECSDQVLDGNETGGKGRAPTIAEMANNFWGLLAVLGRLDGSGQFKGARLWAFPQRIGKNFTYENVDDEHEARIKYDFGLLKKYTQFIEEGEYSLVDTPSYFDDPKNGKQVFPVTGVVQWKLDDKILRVEIDYTGFTLPKITEPEIADPWQDKYNQVSGELEALKADYAKLKGMNDSVLDANLKLQEKVSGIRSALQDILSK